MTHANAIARSGSSSLVGSGTSSYAKGLLARAAGACCAIGVAASSLLGVSKAHAQDFIAFVDSDFDSVVLCNPVTGVVEDVEFIADANDPLTYNLSTPFEIIQVGSELWLTDQLADIIVRFTAEVDPQYIGKIATGIDNVRGLARIGDTVYVSNAGTNNGAPGDALVKFNLDGTPAGHIVVINPSTNVAVDPFDVVEFEGRLLISDIEGEDLISCNLDGSDAQVFVNGNANFMEFPQQIKIAPTGPGGVDEVWVAAFSSPAGVYRFTDEGVQVQYYAVSTGGRGVYPLPQQEGQALEFLFTDGVVPLGGLRHHNTVTGMSSTYLTGSGRSISLLTLTAPTTCNDIDFNNDGGSFDPTDIDAFLSVFSEGPCVPETSTCDSIDFNNDTGFFDPCDIDSFLLVFSEGPCTPCGQ